MITEKDFPLAGRTDSGLLQLLVSQMWLDLCMRASRDIFGRSLFSLSWSEKILLFHMLSGNLAMIEGMLHNMMHGTPRPMSAVPRSPRIVGFRHTHVVRNSDEES
jgi:hypothetical protein